MINEENVINKIQTDYMANIPQDCFIQSIPRNTPLNQFNSQQKIALDHLIDPTNNLHLSIIFKDLSNHKSFEYTEDDKEKLIQNSSQLIIESIHFKLASALIFISLYYQDEVLALSNQVTIEKNINSSLVIVAIIVALICLFIFISFHQQLHQSIRFIVFAIGFIAIAYLYEVIRQKNKKDKKIENQFYTSQYLALMLEQFSTHQFKLDPPEFTE